MKTFLLLILFTFNSVQSQTTWFSQNSGTSVHLYSTCFIDNLTGYAVGDTGKILKTTNGGNNWNTQITGYLGKLKSVYFLNENTGYVVGGNGVEHQGSLLKTTNGGVNWNISLPFYTNQNAVFFTSLTSGYVVGGTQPYSIYQIYKSINNGNTWSTQVIGGNNFYTSIYFTDINIGFTVGSSGLIVKTTNGGLNWNTLFSNTFNNLNSIRFSNDSIGYIAGEGGQILKTTNGGNNWNILTVLGIFDNFNSLYFTSLEVGFVVGQGSTIVKTINGGANWESELSPSIQTLNSVFFADGNTGYAVGNSGTIIKTTNGGGFKEPSINVNPKLLMEGMYNPFLNTLSRRDTITLYLRDAAVPYILRDSCKGVIDSVSFSNQFIFTNSLSSTYYIVAKHFNSIETWSKTGGILLINNGTNYYYDFTTSISQAYGNNLKLVGLKYTTFSGDVNQDGFINLTDLIEVYNNSVSFVSGSYIPSDLNGDGNVDLTDVTLCYNNTTSFIRIRRP